MTEKTYTIEGMTCNHCVMAVKMELKNLALENFEVEIGSAKVKFDDNKVSEEEIINAIDEAGYKVV